jgi:hypothetical protein
MQIVHGCPDDLTILAGHIINMEYGLPYFIDGQANATVNIYAPKNVCGRSLKLYIPYIDVDQFIDSLTLVLDNMTYGIEYYQHPNIVDAIKNNDIIVYKKANGEITYIPRNTGRSFDVYGSKVTAFKWDIARISTMQDDKFENRPSIIYDKFNVFNRVNDNTYLGIPIFDKCNKLVFDNTYKNPIVATYYGPLTHMSNKPIAYTKSVDSGTCNKCAKILCEICFDYFGVLYCPMCYRKKISHKTKYYTIYDVKTKYIDLLTTEQTEHSNIMCEIYNTPTTIQDLVGPDFTYQVLLMGANRQYLGVLDNYYLDLDLRAIPGFHKITHIIPCKLYA